MSIYQERNKPAYRGIDDVPVSWSENPLIRKWWEKKHDSLLEAEIRERGFGWYWRITDSIVEMTPRESVENWKNEDPLCKQYAWYNVLMYFAMSRARALGLDRLIPEPQNRECLLCGMAFLDRSLPQPLIDRLGINNLFFCSPCLSGLLFPGTGNPKASRGKVLSYLKQLSDLAEVVPSQGFGEKPGDLSGFDKERLIAIVRLFQTKPTTDRVRRLLGSWLKALVAAGVLEDGTRPLSRGTQCVASDGHECFSLAEKTIDDWLSRRHIPHAKEPKYPEGGYRGDFLVKGFLIEYLGLTGSPEYDEKTQKKREICAKHGIRLIEVYPQDLVDRAAFVKKLQPVLT